jgi:hypothetical protein
VPGRQPPCHISCSRSLLVQVVSLIDNRHLRGTAWIGDSPSLLRCWPVSACHQLQCYQNQTNAYPAVATSGSCLARNGIKLFLLIMAPNMVSVIGGGSNALGLAAVALVPYEIANVRDPVRALQYGTRHCYQSTRERYQIEIISRVGRTRINTTTTGCVHQDREIRVEAVFDFSKPEL